MDILDFTGTRYIESATSRPTFSGTAASEVGKTGAQALISFGGQRYTVDVDINGKFTWTAPSDVADGSYSFSVIIRDRAGNNSAPALRTFIVDTTPPEAPKLLNLSDNTGDIQGSFDPNKPTDDKTPTLTGIAQKGTTVYLKDAAGSVIGSAVADKESGEWVITPTTELKEGINSLTLVAEEIFAGEKRTGEVSAPFVITVAPDSILIPGVATITNAEDNAGTYTGKLLSDAVTDDTTPTLYGTALAGSTVRIQYRSGGSWFEDTATLNGTTWTWTPPAELAEGAWEFRANAGSGWTDEFVLNINLSPQSELHITHAWDDVAPFTGSLSNGAVTDDKTPTLHGRAEANSLVYLHYRPATGSWELLGSALAGADGRWQYETERVAAGDYEFQASSGLLMDDMVGSFTLKIINPGTFSPIINYAWDDEGGITGVINQAGETNDSRPELRGTAEANSIVQIEKKFAGDAWVSGFSVIADASGMWSFTPEIDLELGAWSFRAQTLGSQYSGDYAFVIVDYERATTKWDFESLPLGVITKNTWDYDGLLFNFRNHANLKFEVADNIFGKSLWIQTLNNKTNTEHEITIDLPEESNFIQLMAGDWEGETSYISAHDKNGNEIGREYATDVRSDITQLLTLYTTKNTISYVKIVLKSSTPNFTIDNIVTKVGYDPVTQPNSGAFDPSKLAGQKFSGKGTISANGFDIDYNINEGFSSRYLEPSFTLREFSEYKLNFHGTNKVIFEIGGKGADNNPKDHSVEVFSTTGKLLYSDDLIAKFYFFKAPEGESIGYINIKTDELHKGSTLLHEVFLRYLSWGELANEIVNNPAEINDENNHIDLLIVDTEELNSLESSDNVNAITMLGHDQCMELSQLIDKFPALTKIDITGDGINQLNVDIESLLSSGDKDLFIEDGKIQLMVNGNIDDIVQFKDILPEGSDISEWQHQAGTVTVAGVEYQVYSHGDDAELLIQQGVKTELI